MNSKAVNLVIICLLTAGIACAKERPKLRVFVSDSSSSVLEFVKYDKTKFLFDFKSEIGKEQLRISKVIALCLDTSIHRLPKPDFGSKSDEVHLRNGDQKRLLFSDMEKDKLIFGLAVEKNQQRIPIESLSFVVFNHEILNIDRHEFGTDFNLLDEATSEEMAGMFASEVESTSKIIADSIVQDYLDSLTDNLTTYAKGTRKKYTTKLINSDQVNAFTPGGGRIFIYRGLLEKLSTESELAGVIGHEMGHNIGNHMAQQYSKQMLYNGVISAAGAILNQNKNEWAKSLTQAGSVLAYFSIMKYGRNEERQADLLGCYNLYNAGIDPHGMITLFETFSKMGGHAGNVVEEWSMSHPDPDERKENIATELSELDVDGMIETSDRFNWVKQYVTALPPPQLSMNFWQDTTTVMAGNGMYKALTLTDPKIKNPRLVGSFVAAGGNRNDITFHIFDEVNFINWKNQNSATGLLSTPKLTAYEVDLRFTKPGNYYVVFDNRDSWATNRFVNVNLSVQYTER